MSYSQPVTELIEKRFSCRSYSEKPLEGETRQQLESFIDSLPPGPFGSRARFQLVAATEQDRKALRGLVTYGFIKGATAFVIGGVEETGKSLEDFGYQMERIILSATDLGLGTCWLGGTFSRSRFARKISASDRESVPAVSSVGYIADKPRRVDALIRRGAGAEQRVAWDQIFFEGGFGAPLSKQAAGPYALPLDMVRLAPSASNQQPWRIVKDGDAWHFYLQRTSEYRDGGLMRMADMKRIDMGIAMSHFELTAGGLGLNGRWSAQEPDLEVPNALAEYLVSWVGG